MKTEFEVEKSLVINNASAFKLGNNILDRWKCSLIQKYAILGIPKSSYHRYLEEPHSISLSKEQLERLSYITNIHQTLRVVFSNAANTYDFMKMENHNPYFNGRTPLSIIDKGSLDALYEVFKWIDSMKKGL
ncbi:antitoxin Xre-like helix-turn-helix domain-containing protein [Alteromonas stellipolaris]|uniref:antitoxin Xre-like helix-turn-helix domain-containing protein n=1 Tax=Alteromonas stellipolaris TaxID=233316 RepID=UPI0026E40948|nr:antitoxin Xre-like helix-turn-helix domain-containing protein [Alteromonas stellipolaris]MDO6536267.1 hypothetical protein [Alteromonas stellipolaris]MDO6627802.1 hypothetical protein [Alteromonas stellipolaris]